MSYSLIISFIQEFIAHEPPNESTFKKIIYFYLVKKKCLKLEKELETRKFGYLYIKLEIKKVVMSQI